MPSRPTLFDQILDQSVGVDGSKIWSSQLDRQEWHPELQDPFTKQKIYRQMTENTPEIASASGDIKSLIIAGNWKQVVPKRFKKDKEAARALELCEEAWDGMSTPFSDVIDDGLTGLEWGYCIQWIQWEDRDGLLLPKTIEIRPQYTAYGWMREDSAPTGRIVAFRQRDPMMGTLIDLPLSNCIHSTFGTGTGGPEGKAGLRFIFIPWRNMMRLINIATMSEERSGLGVWDVQVPPEVLAAAKAGDSAKQADLEDIVQGMAQLSAGERNSILRACKTGPDGKPTGWDIVQFPQVQRNDSINKLIQSSRERMMIGLGTQYLLLGLQGAGGGTAGQTSGQMSRSEAILQGIGNRYANILSVQVNRRICEYNGIDPAYASVWTYRNKRKVNLAFLDKLTATAAAAGIPLLDETDRNDLREAADLSPSESE